jgi:hypothetical protein
MRLGGRFRGRGVVAVPPSLPSCSVLSSLVGVSQAQLVLTKVAASSTASVRCDTYKCEVADE